MSSPSPLGDRTHLFRSPLLAEARTIDLRQGTLEYFKLGTGPAAVFAHGWGVNANLWRRVAAGLKARFTCYVLDLPFGAHRVPAREDADLSPDGCGRLIGDLIEALDLEDVTLVGNDSGAAYSQVAVSQRPGRIARLVLNSSETPHDDFPPPPFDGLPKIAQDPSRLKQALTALRDPAVRMAPAAYGLLAKHPIEQGVFDSYALPPSSSDGVLRDYAKVMSTASSEPIHRAGARLVATFDKPVLLAWASEDRVFPVANARRYAEALPNASMVLVEDAYSFVPEDQPDWLAGQIQRFAGGTD